VDIKLVPFMGRAGTQVVLCCKLLLRTLECHRMCGHARLACFVFETNQHFVGSARIAVLCLKIVISYTPSRSNWKETLINKLL